MFCFNCGKELSKEQKFCVNCGAENKVFFQGAISSHVLAKHSETEIRNQTNTIFNRDVLVNYLSNLRTLEVVNSRLIEEIENLEYKIGSLGIRNRIKPRENFDWKLLLSTAGFFGVVFLISNWVKNGGFFGLFEGLGAVISVISLILTIGSIIMNIVWYIQDGTRYENDIKAEEYRINAEKQEKNRLLKILPNITEDLNENKELLKKAYSINIIPAKYRNIYGAYFLYEYISTSTATLSEALYQCVLDEISQKLDVVIRQQRETIMLLARQNALSEEIVRQNEQLIRHAIATENNTALAAQYSEVAAVNTATTSQIQSYYFFKNGL